jgi:hypothetical protein
MGHPATALVPWWKCISPSRKIDTEVGSFDFVRLAPHFAQDDKVSVDTTSFAALWMTRLMWAVLEEALLRKADVERF